MESSLYSCCCTRSGDSSATDLYHVRPTHNTTTSTTVHHHNKPPEQDILAETVEKHFQPCLVVIVGSSHGQAHGRAYLGIQYQAFLPELPPTL